MSNPNWRRPSTALVIGGGMVGLACAVNLRRRGIDTSLVDANQQPRPASWGNAGHIAVEQVEPLASMRTLRSFPRQLFWRGGALALPWRACAMWLPFAARLIHASFPARFAAGTKALESIAAEALPAWRRLTAHVGAQALIAEDGHFVVWETASGAHAGRESLRGTRIGTTSYRDVTSQEATTLSSLLARPPADAVRFSGTARARDPGDLLDSLSAGFIASGGALRHAVVHRLSVGKSRAIVELESGERISADMVVAAAGVGTGELLEQIGHRVPIIAERGYHIQSAITDWPDMPPVVFEERSMIVNRFHSGLRATSFVEFGRRHSPPDARKWQRLRSHARDLGLAFGEPATEWMGARPTLPDYLPAIGRSHLAGNLWYAFGHQHLGLTLAAVTGEMIGAMALGDEPMLDARSFSLDRF
jgi:glycine/D-amino acid oxidase-like deaminating enzyme